VEIYIQQINFKLIDFLFNIFEKNKKHRNNNWYNCYIIEDIKIEKSSKFKNR